jgi:arylsulfatase A-like enzyme
MSMFTGLHPEEHGVLRHDAVLADDVETFPEVFQRAGFQTAGFTEGGYVSGRYGFRRGFDRFRSRDKTGERQLRHTFARGVAFLESLAPADRFLLFLHTYAVHSPYDAPERYRQPFWPGPPPTGAIAGTPKALEAANDSRQPLTPAAVAYVGALYDAGIRETDEVLRAFFADLDRLGLGDAVTVLITSDHGEELRDHGRFHHTQVYREVVRVPLLVLHPSRRRPTRRAEVVQLVDLAPTLYELAGLPFRGRPSGRSLARRIGVPSRDDDGRRGAARALGETGEQALYRRDGIRVESVLLRLDGEREARARVEYYDVTADPGQRRNLAGSHRGRTREMLQQLLAFELRPRETTPTEPLDEELRRQLEALGYLR